MLSRTADHLYWMSRYVERAESLARLVDAHYRMSLLPQAGDNMTQSLSAAMTALRALTMPAPQVLVVQAHSTLDEDPATH